MASASSKPHHARSSSWPSGPHPLVVQYNELRCRIKSHDYATSTSIINGLSGLLDLHECVDSLLLMPGNQRDLARKYNEKEANLLLDGSLRILDVCGAAKDSLSQAKQSTNELQSLLRRRVSGPVLTKEVKAYLSKRKMTKRSTQKVLNNSKDARIINNSNDEKLTSISSILREIEMDTVAVLESLLSFMSCSNGQALPSKWSLVSRLTQSGTVTCKDASALNEFNKVDSMLQSLINQGANKVLQSENAQANLGHLESTIQHLEQRVESLFRTLIRKRVTLLNILNP